MSTRHLLLSLTFVANAALLLSFSVAPSKECVYTLYVKTGSVLKAGTDATVSVSFSDSKGKSVVIENIKEWGLMGHKHDYFERDNLDAFTGRGPCIEAPICRLNLSSDGSGSHPGWFCEYVEVTSTGPHMGCSKSVFFVDQWLALDAPPYNLSAVIDGCHEKKKGGYGRGDFAARNLRPLRVSHDLV